MTAVAFRRAPSSEAGVSHLVRLRKRTERLLTLRRAPMSVDIGCFDWGERHRLVSYGLFSCRQDYAKLGLLAEWRAEWASEHAGVIRAAIDEELPF